MNNSTTELGSAAAPTAILALDLAILHEPVPAEVRAYIAHQVTCADAIGSVYSSARLPASVSVEITRQLNADDGAWFDNNPTRSFRYRDVMNGEYLLNICIARPHGVLVRQVSQGARLIAPICMKSPAGISVEPFEAKRNQRKLNDDDVLALVFDVYCAFPGEPLDLLNLLRSVDDHKFYRRIVQAAHALKAPAS